jgi:monoamine oxidase
VGAGFAGLGAARTLHGAGKRILVLEAQGYVGGRAHTVLIGDGTTSTELGANWIVSASESSVLFDIAKASVPITTVPYGLDEPSGVWTDLTPEGLPSLPFQVPSEEFTPLAADLFQRFLTFQRPLQSSSRPDQSLEWTLDEFRRARGLSDYETRVLNFTLDSIVVQEYADDLKDLSVKWWEDYGPITKGYAMLDQRVGSQGQVQGYSGVVNSYKAPIESRIRLNAVVTRIDWRSRSVVEVNYKQNGRTQTVQARNVIVTAPLGVLKANAIAFVPALPPAKATSIRNLGMGLLNKVIMRFSETDIANLPWGRGLAWIEKMARAGEQGRWTSFLDLRLYTGTNVVVAWTAGSFAERVEGLSDADIKAEVKASLESMFGVGTVPEPSEWIITRWGQNEHIRGSYSYYPVNTSPQDRENIKAPLGNRVFFAGEATSTRYYGTTRGALEEGIEAGRNVLKKLKRMRRLEGEGEMQDAAESVWMFV